MLLSRSSPSILALVTLAPLQRDRRLHLQNSSRGSETPSRRKEIGISLLSTIAKTRKRISDKLHVARRMEIKPTERERGRLHHQRKRRMLPTRPLHLRPPQAAPLPRPSRSHCPCTIRRSIPSRHTIDHRLWILSCRLPRMPLQMTFLFSPR